MTQPDLARFVSFVNKRISDEKDSMALYQEWAEERYGKAVKSTEIAEMLSYAKAVASTPKALRGCIP